MSRLLQWFLLALVAAISGYIALVFIQDAARGELRFWLGLAVGGFVGVSVGYLRGRVSAIAAPPAPIAPVSFSEAPLGWLVQRLLGV